MIPMEKWLYVLACVVVPIAWGVAVVWVTNRVERFVVRRSPRPRLARRAAVPPLEYHI
jgi:hypothetical protein